MADRLLASPVDTNRSIDAILENLATAEATFDGLPAGLALVKGVALPETFLHTIRNIRGFVESL
jgi:hypothetical protein